MEMHIAGADENFCLNIQTECIMKLQHKDSRKLVLKKYHTLHNNLVCITKVKIAVIVAVLINRAFNIKDNNITVAMCITDRGECLSFSWWAEESQKMKSGEETGIEKMRKEENLYQRSSSWRK